MESSSITIKWFNSLDHTFYKFITMTQKEKKEKFLELSKQILELKKLSSTVATKKTIQSLQQQLDKLNNATQN
jgi:hypothetical protein